MAVVAHVGRVGRRTLQVFATVVCAFLIVPTLFVIPYSISPSSFLEFPPSGVSGKWYRVLFTDPQWRQAFVNSLEVGLIATVLATTVGTVGAFGLRRLGRSRPWFSALFTTPLYVPSIVLALGFYSLFASIGMAGSKFSIALAHSVIAMPFVLLPVAAALEGQDRRLERAAQSMGASNLRILLEITLPGIRLPILTGALFAFLTSFDEFVITLFLSAPATTTLPVQMWNAIQYSNEPVVAAAGALILCISTAVIVGGEVIGSAVARRRRKASR